MGRKAGRSLLVIVLLMQLALPRAFAEAPRLLGRALIFGGKLENARMQITPCRYLWGVKLKAGRDVFIYELIAEFRNGQQRSFQLYQYFLEGEESAWLRFADSRCVYRIRIIARSQQGPAGVTVFGEDK